MCPRGRLGFSPVSSAVCVGLLNSSVSLPPSGRIRYCTHFLPLLCLATVQLGDPGRAGDRAGGRDQLPHRQGIHCELQTREGCNLEHRV